jgi:hypothetical protein
LIKLSLGWLQNENLKHVCKSGSIFEPFFANILVNIQKKVTIKVFRTKLSRCRDVVLEGRTIELGESLGAGKGNGEGEVSLQATWDQGGRGSHHTERRDSK